MASVSRHSTRNGFRVVFYVDGKRKEWYTPAGEETARASKAAEKLANQIGSYLEDLAHAKSTGDRAKPETKAWVASLDNRNRSKLAEWGLAEPISERLSTEAGNLLGPFVDSYIETRTDAKSTTITNYKQTRRLLVEHFGERKPLRSITAADCEKWRRWLLARIVTKAQTDTDGKVIAPAKTMAQPSVSKHIKRAKTIFANAVDDTLIEASPFAKVKAGSDIGAQKHNVDAGTAWRILKICPDADWRCVFALARWGGLRRDCEIQQLKWSDIDWEADRITIESGKTGQRQCPLFPELRKILLEASEIARTGSVFVVGRLATHSNLGAGLSKIVEKAGIPAWPKMFNALRATRRTELQRLHPSHVVDTWMGHSSETACNYYLQVTDEDWKAATVPIRSNIGSNIKGENGSIRRPTLAISNHQSQQKTPQKHTFDASRGVSDGNANDPYGVRTNNESDQQNTSDDGESLEAVPTLVPTLGPEISESDIRQLQTIIDAWQWMPEAERALAYSLARRALGKPVFG